MESLEKKKPKSTYLGPAGIGVVLFFGGVTLMELGSEFSEHPKVIMLSLGFAFIAAGVALFIAAAKAFKKQVGKAIETSDVAEDKRPSENRGDAESASYAARQEAYHCASDRDPEEEHIVCFSCGHINDPGSETCSACKKPLFRVCPSCGYKNELTALHCHCCGHDFASSQESE